MNFILVEIDNYTLLVDALGLIKAWVCLLHGEEVSARHIKGGSCLVWWQVYVAMHTTEG